MNEYRFRGIRNSDGAPVESRMGANDEKELEKILEDYGIDLQSAYKLSSQGPSRSVSLGCGTLILIAIIVMIFSGNDDQVEQELRQLKNEVQQLKSAVGQQTRQLDELAAGIETSDE